MKEIIAELTNDFKETFELPKDKKERKEFFKEMLGGLAMVGCCYIMVWFVYIFAPEGYWPW